MTDLDIELYIQFEEETNLANLTSGQITQLFDEYRRSKASQPKPKKQKQEEQAGPTQPSGQSPAAAEPVSKRAQPSGKQHLPQALLS